MHALYFYRSVFHEHLALTECEKMFFVFFRILLDVCSLCSVIMTFFVVIVVVGYMRVQKYVDRIIMTGIWLVFFALCLLLTTLFQN